MGVLFGIAVATAIVVLDGVDGVPVLFFMLALLMGGRVSRWVRRALEGRDERRIGGRGGG